MDNEHGEETNEEPSQFDNDWENRLLCSDGNCIGVIGADGRCKECGKKYDAEMQPQNAFEEDVPEEQEQIEPAGEGFDDDDWENRRLCSDGNCIGVIGADGRCRECGKPFEG